MSAENVGIVRKLVEAFNRRDLPAMTELFAADVEWEPGGPAAIERSLYRGRDEVAAGFAATWKDYELFEIEESEVRDPGDSVVLLGRARMRGDASQVEFDQVFAIHFVIAAGRISRFQGFLSWQAALEAAGLRE